MNNTSKDSALPADHQKRMKRTLLSLQGLSVGDAFGERFFCHNATQMIANRLLPASPWSYTDDTAMAISIYNTLDKYGYINQDYLAQCFARSYMKQPGRGYGVMTHRTLSAIFHGTSWQRATRSAFNGQGSMGNGAAMRVGIVGAYFADDLEKTASNARASARVTHFHIEAQAGAIAVAVAAACSWQLRHKKKKYTRDIINLVINHTPASKTRNGLIKAFDLPFNSSIKKTVSLLGNGSRILAQDTVPISLWCAARHLDNYEKAIWTTVSALGDRDTTCAIVGSIVALSVGRKGIPQKWFNRRENLVL